MEPVYEYFKTASSFKVFKQENMERKGETCPL